MMSIKLPLPVQFGVAMVVATVVSAWVLFTRPLPAGDPLLGTIAVLPLTVTSLVWLGRWGQARGGRNIPVAIGATECLLLAVLVLLTIGREHLGLGQEPRTLDGLLFGGLVLLLAHRVGWLIAVLRPSLGTSLPARAPWPFFALPLLVYLSILPWSAHHHAPAGDEPHYLLLTHSLAHDLDADLENNYEQGDSLRFAERRLTHQPGDPVSEAGRIYSRHNLLLPLFLAPGYRLLGFPVVLGLMAVLAAAACWLTLGLAHGYAPDQPGEALLAYALLAFTPPFLLFSYQVWVEVPAAVLTLLALRQIQILEKSETMKRRDWLGLILPLVLLPLLKLRFLLIAAPLACLAIWRGNRSLRKPLFLPLVVVVAVGCGILIFNQTMFQNPFKYHRFDELLPEAETYLRYLQGLTGLAFDCAFGLFASAPIWMLLLPAMVVAICRRSRVLIDFVIVFSLYLLLLVPRVEWFGGWSPPFRYGIVMLPVLALWLIPVLSVRHRFMACALFTGLGVLTGALTLLWLVEPGWTYNLAHGRSHLLDLLGIRMEADIARFFPSSTRPRTATWLWPPITLVALSLLWWYRKRPGRHAAALGIIMVLLCLFALIGLASYKVPRVIEFEDPWIAKDAGQVFPELWRINRPHYRGGWILPQGGTVTVPLVSAFGRLTLRVDLRSHSVSAPNGILELRDESDEVQARQPFEGSGEWQEVVFDDLSMNGERCLKLTLLPQGDRGRAVALLDRAYLRWVRGPGGDEAIHR